MKEVMAYKCDYCGRLLKTKSAAARHENVCKNSPKNKRLCYGCANYRVGSLRLEIYSDIEVCRKILDGHKCHKSDFFLYNPMHMPKELLRSLKCEHPEWSPMPSIIEGCPYYEHANEEQRMAIYDAEDVKQKKNMTNIEKLEAISTPAEEDWF